MVISSHADIIQISLVMSSICITIILSVVSYFYNGIKYSAHNCLSSLVTMGYLIFTVLSLLTARSVYYVGVTEIIICSIDG